MLSILTILLSSIAWYTMDSVLILCLRNHPLFANAKSFRTCISVTMAWLFAIVSSSMDVISIIKTPSLLSDPINVQSTESWLTLCVVSGYFISDVCVIVFKNDKVKINRSQWFILLHHSVSFTLATLPLYNNLFHGFVIIGLLVEVHAVFLQLRMLFCLLSIDKTTFAYNSIALMNIVSYSIRIGAHLWIVYLAYYKLVDYIIIKTIIFICTLIFFGLYVRFNPPIFAADIKNILKKN